MVGFRSKEIKLLMLLNDRMLLNQPISERSRSQDPVKIYQLADDTNLMNF